MHKYSFLIVLLLLLSDVGRSQSKLQLQYDCLSETTLQNKAGESVGKGDFQRVLANYELPLCVRHDSLGRLDMWALKMNGGYSWMDNHGVVETQMPDKTLQASASAVWIHPLRGKWTMIASLGAGFYASPSQICAQSILVNGGIIFSYKVNPKLAWGVGAGVTNNYGAPIVMPMLYLKYHIDGKWELNIEAAGRMYASGAYKPNKKLKLELVLMEMDGLTNIYKVEGKYKLYSSTIISTYFRPTINIGKRLGLYADVGLCEGRSSQLTSRSLSNMMDEMKGGKNRYMFKASLRVSAGMSFRF